MIYYYDPLPDKVMDLDTIPEPNNRNVPEDREIFGFGKQYNTKTFGEVPASYLHWFYTTVKCHGPDGNIARILRYIEHNIMALKDEHKDGIWKRPQHLSDGK